MCFSLVYLDLDDGSWDGWRIWECGWEGEGWWGDTASRCEGIDIVAILDQGEMVDLVAVQSVLFRIGDGTRFEVLGSCDLELEKNCREHQDQIHSNSIIR